ncbi:hypothetical protein Bca101_056323 [Brassica carinata]
MSRLFTGSDPFLGCFVSILSRIYQSDGCSRNSSSSLTGSKKANEIESEIMWNHWRNKVLLFVSIQSSRD